MGGFYNFKKKKKKKKKKKFILLKTLFGILLRILIKAATSKIIPVPKDDHFPGCCQDQTLTNVFLRMTL